MVSAALAWPLRGPEGVTLEQDVDAAQIFAAQTLSSTARIDTDPDALAQVAATTLAYLRTRASDDPLAVHPGLLGELGVTLRDVERTLETIIHLAQTDPDALTDPAQLAERFVYYRWRPDRAAAAARGIQLPADRIRMTRYLVYQFPGSPTKTATYTHALYAPPHDEGGMSRAEADARTEKGMRHQYTRGEVMSGVYEPNGAAAGGAAPLVWLTRRGVYEAMMQGTIEVTLPDGRTQMFNVDRPNDMPYVPSVRDPSKQDRYWYFAPVAGVMGWGEDRAHKVALQPLVSVAGDVYNLGLGKIVALERGGVMRLAVLADTGGAFQPNLFQLDLYTGAYPSTSAFQTATRDLPATPQAGILIARRPATTGGMQPLP